MSVAEVLDHERFTLAQDAARLRALILDIHALRGGHLGSSLSIVEILTVLAGDILAPGYNEGVDGDRLVLSKGHAALAFYCRLALEGRVSHRDLRLFATDGAQLEPHPDERKVPAVGVSSGSLGLGLSAAAGLALGARLKGRTDLCAVIVGDGETNEGQIWEAAQSAPRLKLGNLLVVIDRNGLQQDGAMRDILPMPDVCSIWGNLGWLTTSADGHDPDRLAAAARELLAGPPDRPKLLVADTIKGAGVPFLEGRAESHFPPPLRAEEIAMARYVPAPDAAS